jgi:hypothetical protein
MILMNSKQSRENERRLEHMENLVEKQTRTEDIWNNMRISPIPKRILNT